MNTPKHTAGPWRIGCTTNSQRIVFHDDNTPGAASGIVARVTVRQCWEAEQEANARLIAAAPELLAALVALDNYLSNNLSSDYPTGIDLSSLEFRNASKAIAKATGSSA